MKNLFAAFMLIFLLSACADECKDVVCNNGGICVNGLCDCPDGFEGPSCDQETTPQSVRVGSISLTSVPPDNNGSNWDLFDGPDVYYQITKDGDVIAESEVREDSFTAEWNAPISFNDPAEVYEIRVLDDDGVSNPEFVGGISFVPYRSNAGFPDTYELTCDDCTITLVFNNVDYSF